ncbi:hypothetical protein ACFYOK_29555 [Microbispora bryophytorum]|uniref:hypothetical protein n=1 Tax=Microbispora bryophytorum TaxID=1460882 RepID=UPI0033F50CC6
MTAASGTPTSPARPLTGPELNQLAAQVRRRLGRGRDAYAGVVPVIGRPPVGGDHVLVAARTTEARRTRGQVVTAAESDLIRLALGDWTARLQAAGYVVARRDRLPALVVRPTVRLTPHELYEAVDALRAERGMSWEDLARDAALTPEQLVRFQARVVRRGARGRLESWLRRHSAPPSTSTPTPQEGAPPGCDP